MSTLTPGQGTTPPGAENEAQAAAWVRGMFSTVAPSYDRLNHLLSFQIDKSWRRKTVSALRPILQRPDARVLDLCCGTGDLTLELQKAGPARVFGSDFCHPMLTAAQAKQAARLFEGDGLQLPLADSSFDLITCAFGFRNFTNYRQGIAEFYRVLKPGGTAAILEFSTPPLALVRLGYDFYSNTILPFLGGLLSGNREAYTYLPASVKKFPDADDLATRLRAGGFGAVQYRRFTFGIVALHLARKVAP